MKSVSRPILRYHGGKWRLAPWIISHFPAHRIYVEPYGGAGSVLLQKPRSFAEVYNDLDDEIVNLFEIFRERGEELLTKLRLTPYARSEFIKSFQPSPDKIEQARRTVVRSYLNRGSDFTRRKKGDGGIMMGGFRARGFRMGTTAQQDWANYPEAVHGIIERLRGVVIECKPALEIFLKNDSQETLTYVDPPYVADTRCIGDNYRYEMTDEDHRELHHCLENSGGGDYRFGISLPALRRAVWPLGQGGLQHHCGRRCRSGGKPLA